MSFTDPDDVYATCTAAADYLQQYGLYRDGFWVGGAFVHGSPVCLYGAIAAATGLTNINTHSPQAVDAVMDFEACPASGAVQDEISARTGLNVDIAHYSDELAVDVAEVIDLLRDVAAKHQPDAYRSGSPG